MVTGTLGRASRPPVTQDIPSPSSTQRCHLEGLSLKTPVHVSPRHCLRRLRAASSRMSSNWPRRVHGQERENGQLLSEELDQAARDKPPPRSPSAVAAPAGIPQQAKPSWWKKKSENHLWGAGSSGETGTSWEGGLPRGLGVLGGGLLGLRVPQSRAGGVQLESRPLPALAHTCALGFQLPAAVSGDGSAPEWVDAIIWKVSVSSRARPARGLSCPAASRGVTRERGPGRTWGQDPGLCLRTVSQ